MAAGSILSAMSAEPSQSVHPFFTRQKEPTQSTTNEISETNAEDVSEVVTDEAYKQSANSRRAISGGRSKSKDDAKGRKEGRRERKQRTLGEIVNSTAVDTLQDSTIDLFTSEPDFNVARRKRCRTGEHSFVDTGSNDDASPQRAEVSADRMSERGPSPRVLVPVSSSPPPAALAEQTTSSRKEMTPTNPPKKVLRLNANGTFSSPPTKKPKETMLPNAESQPTKRRGRPRKPTVAVAEKGLIVKIHYGANDSKREEFGMKINRILVGDESADLLSLATPTKQHRNTLRKKTPKKPPKALHPFFGGNPKEQPTAAPKQASPRKTSAVTPGKLRMQTHSDRKRDTRDALFTSSLLKDRMMIKHAGAKEPPWPTKEQTHVRGMHSDDILLRATQRSLHSSVGRRKRKQALIPFSKDESILSRFAAQLVVEEGRQLRDDGFHEPDRSLHIPDRLLLPGIAIARKVSNELSVELSGLSEDELSLSSEKRAHPALQRLYDKIPATLTAYDESKGEASGWAQKYAPATSDDVLQPESEMQVLRGWLKSLAVQAVVGVPDNSTIGRAAEKPKKKRRKKVVDMDDFLVDSDEEVHEMSELAEDNGPETTRTAQRSIIQIANAGTKLSNAVLLSGPHGCGKTAAAYAVAKELDFKVFEISSSERRSGRDVLERVGDMTENHLVKHHGTTEAGESSSTESNGLLDDAFQKDLQSGKQGKMNAFFQPKAKPKLVEPKKIVKEKKLKAVQEALKKPSKDQKQSLILLEEVDILFKEDKEFWSTVLKLIITSKRPFIMTCNDEDLVPLQALNLHAILRFCQPPIDLATDYLLLMAANEGHLLVRDAVASLYQYHAHDLRASIAKLDFWCQMGVGDPRGGLTWIYQRWPPGSDMDEKGRRLRVVSNRTFHQSMGLPSRTAEAEDAVLWAWRESGIAPSTAMGWYDMPEKALPIDVAADAKSVWRALKQYSLCSDALSAADANSTNGLPGAAPLDCTQPDLPGKVRGHYIEGMTLLQTDEKVDYSDLSAKLLVSQFLNICRVYQMPGLRGEQTVDDLISADSRHSSDTVLSRRAFACFDLISTPAEASLSQPGLQQSTFDGPLQTIVLDLAPYVRSIVQYDQALEEQRARLDLLTRDGDGHRAKRARTTRAARSALEGGQRSHTRRERWFNKALDANAVLETGGKDWPRLANEPTSVQGISRDGTDGTEPPVSHAGDDDDIKYE